MNPKSSDAIHRNSIFAWIALATGLFLLVPLIAMQFNSDVNWDAADFIAMGLLLSTAGSLFVLVSRKVSRSSRGVIAIMVAAAFFYIWAELAVGVFTNLGS